MKIKEWVYPKANQKTNAIVAEKLIDESLVYLKHYMTIFLTVSIIFLYDHKNDISKYLDIVFLKQVQALIFLVVLLFLAGILIWHTNYNEGFRLLDKEKIIKIKGAYWLDASSITLNALFISLFNFVLAILFITIMNSYGKSNFNELLDKFNMFNTVKKIYYTEYIMIFCLILLYAAFAVYFRKKGVNLLNKLEQIENIKAEPKETYNQLTEINSINTFDTQETIAEHLKIAIREIDAALFLVNLQTNQIDLETVNRICGELGVKFSRQNEELS